MLTNMFIPIKNGINARPKTNTESTHHGKEKPYKHEIKTNELIIIGHKSQLSTENKLLLYKPIIKPIWTYGVQL